MERGHLATVDMDAFYASVEQRDDPAPARQAGRGLGGASRRGVVCAASYEARPVRRALGDADGAGGLRLCPQLIVVPPDFHQVLGGPATRSSRSSIPSRRRWRASIAGGTKGLPRTSHARRQPARRAARAGRWGFKARNPRAQLGLPPRRRHRRGEGSRPRISVASELLQNPTGCWKFPAAGQVSRVPSPRSPRTRLWGRGGPGRTEQLQRLGLRKIGGSVARADSGPYLEAQTRLGPGPVAPTNLANGIDPRAGLEAPDNGRERAGRSRGGTFEVDLEGEGPAPPSSHRAGAGRVGARLRRGGDPGALRGTSRSSMPTFRVVNPGRKTLPAPDRRLGRRFLPAGGAASSVKVDAHPILLPGTNLVHGVHARRDLRNKPHPQLGVLFDQRAQGKARPPPLQSLAGCHRGKSSAAARVLPADPPGSAQEGRSGWVGRSGDGCAGALISPVKQSTHETEPPDPRRGFHHGRELMIVRSGLIEASSRAFAIPGYQEESRAPVAPLRNVHGDGASSASTSRGLHEQTREPSRTAQTLAAGSVSEVNPSSNHFLQDSPPAG